MMRKRKIRNVGILGFGNMGKAIFNLLKNDPENIFFVHSLEKIRKKGIKSLSSPHELFECCDIVFLCIKPQDFYTSSYFEPITGDPTVISIMAGVKIESIRKALNAKKIIRAMPNLALQVGHSVTGWYTDNLFNTSELSGIEKIFAAFGTSIRLDNEDMLNSITAISGSGPAYVFLFIDALEKAAINMGFNKESAKKAVIGTIEGSLLYLERERETSIENLIERVKSKKGTTEAALNAINIEKYYSSWKHATEKARKRSEELSSYEVK